MRNFWFATSLLFLCGCNKAGPPYSPAEALKMFRIEPGYRIEKFVSEPDVVSPVAMEFDENGRIFVAEDRGYPLNTKNALAGSFCWKTPTATAYRIAGPSLPTN